jgi:ubiquitin carboxyl-terminal hydrolase 14
VQDDTDLTALGLADGAQFLMMGTPSGGELKKPATEIKFVEDMTAEERARVLHEKTGETLPAGLENLGNTCYMNATVQCLKRVNELKDALKTYQGGLGGMGAGDPSKLMATAAK